MLSANDLEAIVSLPGNFYTDGQRNAPSFYPHVLLAEDNECTLRVVQQLLIECGYRVTVARNGRQALDILQRHDEENINLILTDIMMPEVDGLDLVTEVVQHKEWCKLPVIVMSSEASQDAICKAFAVGARDYLVKPIRRNEVVTLWQHVWRDAASSIAEGEDKMGDEQGRSSGVCTSTGTTSNVYATTSSEGIAAAECRDGATTDTGADSQDQEELIGLEAQSSCEELGLPSKRARLVTADSPPMASPQPSLGSAGSAAPPVPGSVTPEIAIAQLLTPLLQHPAGNKPASGDGSDSDASEDAQANPQTWLAEDAVEVAFIRPHEAPDLSSGRRRPAPAYGLPRILSAPSILALERQHCSLPLSGRATPEPNSLIRQQEQQHLHQLQQLKELQQLRLLQAANEGSLKRQREEGIAAECQQDKGAAAGIGGNASDDSHASTATAQADNDASSRAVCSNSVPLSGFSLSGCESVGVKSRMVVSVDLEIAPLDLQSSGSLQGARGGGTGLDLSSLRNMPASQASEASLRILAKAFTAVIPRPCPRITTSDSPASAALGVQYDASKGASSGGSPAMPTSPSAGLQQHSFCRAFKTAADLHAGIMHGDPATWAANRKAALEKLREKKKLRNFDKKVRYESRRRLAESRPRIRGQFVKASALPAAAAQDSSQLPGE